MNFSLGVPIAPSGLCCLVVRQMCEYVLVRPVAVGTGPRAKWGATVQSILVGQAKGIAVIPLDKTKS